MLDEEGNWSEGEELGSLNLEPESLLLTLGGDGTVSATPSAPAG